MSLIEHCVLNLDWFAAVIHEPDGPAPSSQFEHSSIPATVKKLFNLKSNFLTKRDAWAGTFDRYFKIRDTPRDDCPETLPEVLISLRPYGPREDAKLSEFQVELIQLASQLNGDYVLNTYPNIGKNMTVIEGNAYAEDAVKRFVEAGRAALGANDSAIVTMRPSLTSRVAMADSEQYLETINSASCMEVVYRYIYGDVDWVAAQWAWEVLKLNNWSVAVIPVGSCVAVKGADDVLRKPFSFEISTTGKDSIYFIAHSEHEKEEWINSIGRSIVQHSRSGTKSEVVDYDNSR